MRILGIDPGLQRTGYGVIDATGVGNIRLVEAGTITTDPKSGISSRVSCIYNGIADIISTHGPEVLVLEKLYAHYKHPTTAIPMGHARGVICLAANKGGIPVFNYASTQIKSCLTGNGRASKEQMQRAIQARLRLKEIPGPHDVADALAVAICHYWTATSPVMIAVGEPSAHRSPKGNPI